MAFKKKLLVTGFSFLIFDLMEDVNGTALVLLFQLKFLEVLFLSILPFPSAAAFQLEF